MAFRFTCLLQEGSLWSVRVAFFASALCFSTCSLLADQDYGIALRTKDISDFVLVSRLFPLLRTYRSAPGYAAAAMSDPSHIGLIEQALIHDPNAGDLWYDMARMQLKVGNNQGYTAALTQLKRLTPGFNYRVVAVE